MCAFICRTLGTSTHHVTGIIRFSMTLIEQKIISFYNCAMLSTCLFFINTTNIFKVLSIYRKHNGTARLIIQLYVKIILIVIIKRSIPIVSHLQLMASWLCVVFIASSFSVSCGVFTVFAIQCV